MKREDIVRELVKRGYDAHMENVIKNGVVFKGIAIRDESMLAPVIYTEHLIEEAEANGISLSVVVDIVIERYKKSKDIKLSVDKFADCEFILHHAYIGMQKTSSESIEKRPCKLDGLEAFIYLRDRTESGEIYSSKLSSSVLKMINLEVDKVWEQAMNNTFAETQIKSVMSMFAGMDIEVEKVKSDFPQLYVITNKVQYRGASAILDREALREFGKQHGVGKLVVLPSSIHEMLIVPYDEDMNMDDLSCMVKDVNAQIVEPEERLTDKAYLIKL